MKKFLKNIILIMIMLLSSSCSFSKEYDGPKITKLTYIDIDYNGMIYDKYVIDFTTNQYLTTHYTSINEDTSPLTLKSTFTEEEEKIFLDSCFTNGLFDLKESYTTNEVIYDGGGFDLTIEYENGTSKTSIGKNAFPTKVFDKCSTAFYDLCNEKVLGKLPDYYIYPPDVSFSFHYFVDDIIYSTNDCCNIKIANYKWNKSVSIDNDIFLINEQSKNNNKFLSDKKYQIVLFTANYRCKEKFAKINVKEYDYTSDLSNEKLIYSGKWFKQIELDINFNKIYVYELTFKDNDYVQYTFNTYCN